MKRIEIPASVSAMLATTLTAALATASAALLLVGCASTRASAT